jgi:7-cyano-7-deazaguanine synthase
MAAAVVLLSGGMDSATVLAMARMQGYQCHTLSIDYGQRHRAELSAAQRVATALGAVSHTVVELNLRAFGGSALTDQAIAVPTDGVMGGAIPSTYVPARNTIFLSLALARAETLEADDLFAGMNAVDYSGYPDCRPAYVEAFAAMANLATRRAIEGHRLTLHTPIISYSKSDIVRQGQQLGVDFALTVSCYQADSDGLACGVCDACRLRAKGFLDAGIEDVTRYRAKTADSPN